MFYIFFSLPSFSLVPFFCFVLGLATVFTRPPLPLVLANAAAAAVFTRAPLPLVLAYTAAAAVFALAPLSQVLAKATAATVFARGPPPLVLTEAATAAVFTPAPHPLVLADATPAAVFTLVPLPLVLADTAAATVFAPAPLPLVLAEAATAAVFTQAPHPLVLTQGACLGARHLGSRRMARWRRLARRIVWAVHTLFFVLAALPVWPLAAVACRPLQHSLIARRGLLLAIRQQYLARHLLRILHVEGVLCRRRRLRCKVLASTRRIRPHSLQQAVALFSRPAAPRAAWKAGWLAQGWLVRSPRTSLSCLPCRPPGDGTLPPKKKTHAFLFFVDVLRSRRRLRHRLRRRLCCKMPAHLMWGRLTLSCSWFSLLFSSTSRYGFSRSLAGVERHENPGPAAVLALSRMTVRPLLEPLLAF